MKYKSRREQIEKDFLPRCLKTPTRAVIKDELRGAAMVGPPEVAAELEREICAAAVLQVLGW